MFDFVFICRYKLNSPHYLIRAGPGLFSLGALPTSRSHDFRHGCLYVKSSEGGRERRIAAIRYRRRLKIFENFLLFCVREINRFLEIANRGFRKILRVSRNSNLETRRSILKNFEDRGSRIEFRVETVNSYLPGTVRPGGGTQFRRRASAVPNLIAIRFDCSTPEVRP